MQTRQTPPKAPQSSSELTTDQAAQISTAVRSILTYLARLQGRMEQNGFDQADPLYRLVTNAEDAVYRLSVEAQSLSCKGGVGRRE